MIRKRVGVLVGLGVLGAIAIVACGDKILDDGIPKGLGGGGSVGGGANSCWPTAAECYGGKTKDDPGGECLAVRDNSPIDSNGIQHIQLRQNWIRATTPVGNSTDGYQGLVYRNLAGWTQLNWPACYSYGAGGTYIQLFDFTVNTTNNTGDSWVGFAKYVGGSDVPTALTNGLCMVDDIWANDQYALAEPSPNPWAGATTANINLPWPVGLPKPMWRLGNATSGAQPWHVKPTHAKRVAAEFDVSTQRAQLLASFEPGGANYGYDGIFYYDQATGKSHGYARISWLVIYDSSKTYIAVPIREAETTSQFNDPAHPNCVGAFRADALQPPDCKPSTTPADPTFPAWGFPGDPPDKRGQGPATTTGYFLITELEQIFAAALHSTLCVSYPTKDVTSADGWYGQGPTGDGQCRLSPKWNPTNADTGIPTGDWCAETNSTANGACHDAYKNFSYHVFSAFPVQSPSVATTADGGVVPDAGVTGTCKAF